ncbi:hypothetical protein IE53DRAFT_367797 [Violaceomyces palustris]|uniref:Uncharacterized protein n=1 Tax=Violaceomyces palustris TaxID=1673888 RepID=A0ACD0P1D1_9BASI|nr:hypothetical protein IE53DRAFT_367797 [Violaceomyces palustris]
MVASALPRRGHFGGHRVLIASLYLPDTLQFHDPELNSAFEESPEESTAPPSPDTSFSETPLPLHELSSRLAASAINGTDDYDPDMIPYQRTRPRKSFSDKKVNMTELMHEAASAPKLDISTADGSLSGPPSPRGPHAISRRGSLSLDERPGLTAGEDIPVAPASDHGRGAPVGDHLNPASLPNLAPPWQEKGSLTGERSRRSSMNANEKSGSALVPPVAQPEGSGTRTPGARVAGKLGTMTPLSIISDLAAKRGAPIAPTPVPGDIERHHPFGSGAVTPMAGNQTPGNANRPSGGGPSRSFPGLNPTSLSMTKASVEKSKDPSGTPAGLQAVRPLINKHITIKAGTSPLTPGRLASAVASGSINDHGRGAQTAPSPVETRREARFSTKDKSRHTSSSPSAQRRHARASSINSGPPAAPSSGLGRNRSTRAPPRTKIGRRTSSAGRSSLVRRPSTASIDSLNDDVSCLPPYDFVSNPSANGGLINAVKSIERERLRAGKLYIGTLGVETAGWLGDAEKDDIAKRLREERSSVPVWVEDDDFSSSYNQFCKQILWPTFHYTLPTSKGLEHEHEAFRAYWEVNRRFADAIEDVYVEGDIIWINDYHLLLVPQMVRERLPHATIGFFLHIAFPSSEIFRCLSVRETLLKGMLGADLIGFQTHNFCRHFRQTVSRILQLEATPKGIQLDGSFVTVAPFPIGIDVRSLNAKRQHAEVDEWVGKLREKYHGKRIIVGRDKLDWIKGVRQKLLAFEVFLDEHPEWAGEVVLIQVALATTEENEEIGEATDVVSRINNKYASLTYQPVVFLHVQDITFSQYLALLTVADAFLASSLREGMNLTSHEYVVCQEVRHRPLILSEFTGTYSGLRACIGINPWNTKQVAHAIHKALTMGESEMVQRWTDLHRVVVTQTAQQWITSLLGHLERAHLEQERLENMFIPRLEVAQLVSEWRAAHSRLLLLDLEDTLAQIDHLEVYKRGGFDPPEPLVNLLNELTADNKNVVYVMTSMGPSDLSALSERVRDIGLVAENGCFVKHSGENQWTSLVAAADLRPVREILSYFTERTPGSYIEERGASICWRFWSEAFGSHSSHEAQWARRQSAEVSNLIHERFSHSLRVIPGPTTCLIMPRHASRVAAVQHIIMQLSVLGGIPMSSCATPSPALQTPPSPSHRVSVGSKVSQRLQDQPSHPPLDSPYKQPSNYWPLPSGSTLESSPIIQHANARQQSSHGHYNMGNFDFVLALSQDERLLAYVNTLDLFAPVTCTTIDLNKNRGTEAAYQLPPEDVMSALEEIIRFRARDLKWANG